MLQFYSTGMENREVQPPKRFLPQRGASDKAFSLSQRNFVGCENSQYKEAAKRTHDKDDYKKQYYLRNEGKNKFKKYYASQYEDIKSGTDRKSLSQPKFNPMESTGSTIERNQFLANDSNHYHNWKIQKERQYAFQQRQRDSKIAQSQVLDKNEYRQTLQEQRKGSSTSKSSSFLPRENFYRTKPLLRLDKDFKDKPLIKNVQTISEDTPQWCQNTNKYYDPQLIDVTKKGKKQKLKPADIFGNPLVKHENNFMFSYDTPYSGLRSETNKMVICDKEEIQFKKNHTVDDSRKAHINIGWKEKPEKQKYEYKMPEKIFADSQHPFIKKLEFKRTFKEGQMFKKIGSQTNFRLNDKDKPVLLKIGHGEASTINPVKYQQNLEGSRYY